MGRTSRLRVPDYQIMRRVHGYTQKKMTYDAPSDGSPDKHAASDLAITRRIAMKLDQHYPCHPWLVRVDGAQGVAMISLPIIMKRNQSYVVHLSTIAADPGLRCIVKAGGEILERHNVPRAGFQIDHFLAARNANPANRATPRFVFTD